MNRLNESSRLYNLHKGEISAISLALEINNVILLTDDSAARLFASNIKIQVHGTIGLLLRAVRKKIKTSQEVISLLSNIKKISSLHITEKLINEAIEAIRKES